MYTKNPSISHISNYLFLTFLLKYFSMIVLTSEMVHTQISCSQNRNYQVGHCHVQNTRHAECQWEGLYKNTLHANHNVCNSHLPNDSSIFLSIAKQ